MNSEISMYVQEFGTRQVYNDLTKIKNKNVQFFQICLNLSKYSRLCRRNNNESRKRSPLGLVKQSPQCDQIGQLFDACGNNYFAQNHPHHQAIFVKLSKSFIFLVKPFLENILGDIWQLFTGHTAQNQNERSNCLLSVCKAKKFPIFWLLASNCDQS